MLAQLQGKNMVGSPSSSVFSGGLGTDSGLGLSTTSGREQLQRARSSSSSGSGSSPNHTDSILLQPSSPPDSFIHHPFSDSTTNVDCPPMQPFPPPIFGSDSLSVPNLGPRTLSPDSLLLGNSNNDVASTRSSPVISTSFPPQFASTSTSLGVFDINPSTWSSAGTPINYQHHASPPLSSSPNVSTTGFGLDDSLGALGSIAMPMSSDTGGWMPDVPTPSASNGYGDIRVRASNGLGVDPTTITSTPEGRRSL